MNSKLISRRRLAQVLKNRRGKKVVFTNGCFDLLHAGHLKVLEKAKSQGHILVLGLNSDESVRRLKGASRPLVDEKARARLLSGLACVDYVTVFPEDTPYETIAMLKPDILVKGGDYRADEIVGRDLVRKVVRVPLEKGFSTSALIGKIVKAYGGPAR